MRIESNILIFENPFFFNFQGWKTGFFYRFFQQATEFFLCLLTMGTGLGSQEDAVFSQRALQTDAS